LRIKEQETRLILHEHDDDDDDDDDDNNNNNDDNPPSGKMTNFTCCTCRYFMMLSQVGSILHRK
jgi:hypothetical protein